MVVPDIHGVIFDLDGTLVDSEPLHMEAWFESLAFHELHFPHEWFDRFIGQADRVLAEYVVEAHRLDAAVEDLLDRKRRTYHALAAEKATLFPGIWEGLKVLNGRYPMAIATSSSNEDAAAVFHATQVNDFFRAIVTADDVPRLKPAPDCYRIASERLQLPPAHCIAVEDSISGVTAAKTAGLFTIGVTTSQPPHALTAADLVLPDAVAAMRWMLDGMQ